jgi:hypothetical protein
MYGSFRIGIYAYLLEQTQLQNVANGKNKNDISFGQKLDMAAVLEELVVLLEPLQSLR